MDKHKILEKMLETEEYVGECCAQQNTLEYKLAHLVKEEIRRHKWNRGTEGQQIDWEQAVAEWTELYYDDFMAFATDSLVPKKIMNNRKTFRFTRRFGSSSELVGMSKPLHLNL